MKIEKKLKSRKGFTLVELVVVIAVLAILAGVGSVAYSGYINRAKEAADISLLAAIKTAADSSCAAYGSTVKTITVTSSADIKAKLSDETVVVLVGSATQGEKDETDLFKTLMSGNTISFTGTTYSDGAIWNAPSDGNSGGWSKLS